VDTLVIQLRPLNVTAIPMSSTAGSSYSLLEERMRGLSRDVLGALKRGIEKESLRVRSLIRTSRPISASRSSS